MGSGAAACTWVRGFDPGRARGGLGGPQGRRGASATGGDGGGSATGGGVGPGAGGVKLSSLAQAREGGAQELPGGWPWLRIWSPSCSDHVPWASTTRPETRVSCPGVTAMRTARLAWVAVASLPRHPATSGALGLGLRGRAHDFPGCLSRKAKELLVGDAPHVPAGEHRSANGLVVLTRALFFSLDGAGVEGDEVGLRGSRGGGVHGPCTAGASSRTSARRREREEGRCFTVNLARAERLAGAGQREALAEGPQPSASREPMLPPGRGRQRVWRGDVMHRKVLGVLPCWGARGVTHRCACARRMGIVRDGGGVRCGATPVLWRDGVGGGLRAGVCGVPGLRNRRPGRACRGTGDWW